MSPSKLATLYFFSCAVFAVLGALATVLARNPIRGVMGLLLTIGSIAALFLSLSAEFLAAVQLIVYAGAVIVLFLFVLMLLGPGAQPDGDNQTIVVRTLAVVGSLVVSAAGIGAILFWDGSGRVPAFPLRRPEEGSIEAVGQEIFTTGLVPFELSSVLLLVAVVAAVAVARGAQQGKTPAVLPSTASAANGAQGKAA